MAHPTRIKTANDNLPTGTHVLQSYAPDARPSPTPRAAIPDLLSGQTALRPKTRSQSLNFTLILWVGAALLALGSFFFGATTTVKALASVSILWAGLWCSYVSADHGHWRLSELAVVTALAGLLGGITTAANVFGLGLTLMDGLILMSIVPLFIGLLMNSRICVLASIGAALGWAMLTFSNSTALTGAAALLPLIFAGQLFVATKIKSGVAIALTVGTAYYCLLSLGYSLWKEDNLPLTFAAAALFIIGVAHHRGGKAAEDNRLIGSPIHIHLGWIGAMVGAIGFQYLWLNPNVLTTSTASLSIAGMTTWRIIVITALAMIFCSGIMRYKHSQITFLGIFLLTLASAIIPMMLWIPTWPQSLASIIPGIDLMQTVGVMIGASILAMAIGMVLNGARRHSPLMIAMGLGGFVAQAYLLIKPDYLTIDNVVIFGGTCLAALAIGGVIAGSSLAHQAPAPRLKHT